MTVLAPHEVARLRRVELSVRRRLDGLLQGDHHGLLPGPGSESGDARGYVTGDDVRRIDWAVTARTGDVHVRDTIADRELEVTLVVDSTASLGFGTARATKRDVAVATVTAFAVLAARRGNRVGALIAGEETVWVPHKTGDAHVATLLRTLASQPTTGGVPLDLALRRARNLARRRGLVVVVSDFLGQGEDPAWQRELRALGARHEVVAVEVVDPRELELPDVGLLVVEDAETGRRRRVDTADARVRMRYIEGARAQRDAIRSAISAAGASHLTLRTDHDWIADVLRFVVNRRRQATAARGA
jgi:uncharacterized protein (DUF58 family)